MNIESEIKKLREEIDNHNKLSNEHSFAAKTKEAKVRKLEKQVEKLNEILNEQLPSTI